MSIRLIGLWTNNTWSRAFPPTPPRFAAFFQERGGDERGEDRGNRRHTTKRTRRTARMHVRGRRTLKQNAQIVKITTKHTNTHSLQKTKTSGATNKHHRIHTLHRHRDTHKCERWVPSKKSIWALTITQTMKQSTSIVLKGETIDTPPRREMKLHFTNDFDNVSRDTNFSSVAAAISDKIVSLRFVFAPGDRV